MEFSPVPELPADTFEEPPAEPHAEPPTEPPVEPSKGPVSGSTAFKTALRQLSTCVKAPGDETSNIYGRKRSQTRRLAIPHQTPDQGDGSEKCKQSVEVIQQAEKDVNNATRICCALMVDDQPTDQADGPISKQSNDG